MREDELKHYAVYRLTEDVPSPLADRRMTRKWYAAEVIPKGTLLQAIRCSAGFDDSMYWVFDDLNGVGDVTHFSPLGKALLPHLVEDDSAVAFAARVTRRYMGDRRTVAFIVESNPELRKPIEAAIRKAYEEAED